MLKKKSNERWKKIINNERKYDKSGMLRLKKELIGNNSNSNSNSKQQMAKRSILASQREIQHLQAEFPWMTIQEIARLRGWFIKQRLRKGKKSTSIQTISGGKVSPR